ncbi:MAG TPA: DUF3231 family protein [Bacilli bacterium]
MGAAEGKNGPSENLTSAEQGKLWATYLGNTMSICILRYALQHMEDQQIKAIAQKALDLTGQFAQSIKDIFMREGYPIPQGFTDEDVNLGAPKLFSDEFYLFLLKYDGKIGLNLYGIAVSLCTRADVRAFFTQCWNSTAELLKQVEDCLNSRGLTIKPAGIPYPNQVMFVEKQSYLQGFLGKVRPLNALEIAHLHDNAENSLIGKAIAIGFSQVAQSDHARNYFVRVMKMDAKHYEIFSHILQKENIPAPPIIDQFVTTSNFSPFSDKLMIFHKLNLLTMRIRAYGNALSLCARHDLAAQYGRLLLEVGNCAEDGSNILIENGWLEQMPQAPEREALTTG